MTTAAEKLRKLADFLVPENGPDRMCRDWDNTREYGRPIRFCLLGAIQYLFQDGLADGFARHKFPIAGPRPDPSALRKQLLAAADQCEREGK